MTYILHKLWRLIVGEFNVGAYTSSPDRKSRSTARVPVEEIVPIEGDVEEIAVEEPDVPVSVAPTPAAENELPEVINLYGTVANKSEKY